MIFGHVAPFMMVLALCESDSIVNCATAFLQLRKLKQYENYFLCHGTPLAPVLASHDTNGILNCTTAFIRS